MKNIIISFRTFAVSLIISTAFAGVADGQITVDITGVVGSNETTWVWNGTSTVLSNTSLLAVSNGGNVNLYDGSSASSGGMDYTQVLNGADFEGTYVSGSTDDGTGADFRPLGVFLDHDSGSYGDDFAWILGDSGGGGGSGTHSFVSGNTITFSDYTVQFTGFDISDFSNNAVNPANTIASAGDFITATSSDLDGLTLNFTAIPEPLSAICLGLAAIGFVVIRRRNR